MVVEFLSKPWFAASGNITGPKFKNWYSKTSEFGENCTKNDALGLVLSIPIGIPLAPDWFAQTALAAVKQDRSPVNIMHITRLSPSVEPNSKRIQVLNRWRVK